MACSLLSPGARKAAKIIDGIRERYNTSILYEQTDPETAVAF